ncbi:MAG: Nif3-like dinuclear metal center hexameric protein [Bacteroidetes bacterium]|jgi:dinuclear metal center YbgI/SA1388 family protein|nr:Nif3-like dinuclear metal center hexameric protein [Bacteroidota bacterium]MDF2453057.1 Nif3-like dinuclear metal center hexameric protein [Bacteroidota bacterium]
MILQNIITELEKFAPLSYQESYDNCGLLTGQREQEVTGALLCLDCTEAVVEEAIRKKCNLIIAHHPIIFSGLKKLNGTNYVERTVIKAIQHNIAIYACHTNLDNVHTGVNKKIADKLGLIKTRILAPKKSILKKLVTFVPGDHLETLRNSLFNAGAGNIGNYDSCSFVLEGTGSFRGNENSNPFIGEKGKLSLEKETRLELIFEAVYESQIISALKQNHPYEEVAFDIYQLENTYQNIGSGMTGELETEIPEKEFLELLKSVFKLKFIKHTPFLNKSIKKVALCGGSGSFLLKNAINSESDAYISSDFKYHEFFDAENKILAIDIGHYETEQFTPEIFYEIISNKFPTFASYLTETNTNPVNYF